MQGRPEAANTFIKRGRQTVSLTSDDLFDRIINLKFVRWDNSSFVLRSDYEPVFQRDGSIRFIRCRQKPSIKVSYEQVAQDVAIEVDIEVTNLFIDKSQGDPLIAAGAGELFAEGKGNPIETVVVQMGYLAQFPDWTERQSLQDLDAYYELYNDYVSSGSERKSGMQMEVTVLDTYTKGNPPDQVTYFHGIIGNIDTGLVWTHEAGELGKNYGNPGEGEQPWLWNEFYQWITRRFIRASVMHRTTTEWETYTVTENDKEVKLRRIKKGGQKVEIYGYNDYEVMEERTETGLNAARVVNFGALDGAPANFKPDTEWHEVTLAADGLLTDEDAITFGVQCMLSVKLQKTEEPKTGRYGLPAFAGTAMPHTSVMSDSPQNNLGSQIAALCMCYPYLRYYAMPDGNYYFYHVDETKEEMFENIRMNGMSGGDEYGIHPQAMLLPAIYDIAYGGTRTIRCPFFYLIAPMTIVFFMSKYYIGSLVGFYYHPDAEADRYLVLQVKAAFSTVGDENMAELMCVDWTGEFPVLDDNYNVKWTKSDSPAEVAEKVTGTGPGEAARWANIQFFRKRLTIKPYKEAWVDPYKMVDGSWYQVAVKWMFEPLGGLPGPAMFDRNGSWRTYWNDYKNNSPAWFYARAIEDLKKWNDGSNGTRNLFAEERFKPSGYAPLEPSSENEVWNSLTGGAVTKVPLLYGASYIPDWFQDLYGNKDPDTVLVRILWMPEYDESKGMDIDE